MRIPALTAHVASTWFSRRTGLGTLEELFEILTWRQLGIHTKPCGLLEVNGYYDSLLRFLDKSVEEGFVHSKHRAALLISEQPDDLIDQLEAAL